ncbi:MAG: type II toxin-antitoxin system prevent-host-death family antitoxin [Myxococcaceae bacterium]|nr:type II toxin-antitoxin system prevent-host-death family antitoxin [Myxococcaceae bacterium]
MKVANLSDVKNDLSRYVAQVRRGERVRILVRGVAVADLVPVEKAGGEVGWGESELRELERQGILRRNEQRMDDSELNKPGPTLKKGADAVSAIIEERRKR